MGVRSLDVREFQRPDPRTLLVPERFDRIQPRGLVGRVDPEKQPDRDLSLNGVRSLDVRGFRRPDPRNRRRGSTIGFMRRLPMNGSRSESVGWARRQGPAGPDWVRPQAVRFLVSSGLSSSLVAGPVGKRETRFLRFPLFHRAVLVSFFLGHLFLSLRITHDSAGFSAARQKTSHRFARASVRM
jgi:hypothetical protein